MSENYEELQFEDARTFLEVIRRSNPLWLQDGASLTPWVFRGQGNAGWDLVPSAWRESISKTPFFQSILATIDLKQAQRVIDGHHGFLMVVQHRMQQLQNGEFVKRAENVLIFGRPGSGKTMLLEALGNELVRCGYSVCFAPCAKLVQHLLLPNENFDCQKC